MMFAFKFLDFPFIYPYKPHNRNEFMNEYNIWKIYNFCPFLLIKEKEPKIQKLLAEALFISKAGK